MEYTKSLKKAIDYARTYSKKNGQYTGTQHLLLGLMHTGPSIGSQVLSDAGVTEKLVETVINEMMILTDKKAPVPKDEDTPRFKQLLDTTSAIASMCDMNEAGTEHAVLAILRTPDSSAARILSSLEIDINAVFNNLLKAMGEEGDTFRQVLYANHGGAAEEEYPDLDEFTTDLTTLAEEGELDPIIGREKEIQRVIEILSRRTKNNPCLIGEPGVGKTAIIEGLAEQIVSQNVPSQLLGKRILTLDLSGMVAGTKYRGEFEERIKNVIEEASAAGNVLLFIDELHMIIGAGGSEGGMDAANILKPALARGELQIIGATTIKEYRQRIEKDAALERRFLSVMVEEPTKEETFAILKGLRPYYERHHGVVIEDDALRAAVNLSERYINDRCLPDKAIDLIDEAAAKARLGDVRSLQKMMAEEQKLRTLAEEKEKAVIAGNIEKAREIQQEQERLREKNADARKRISRSEAARILSVSENDIADVVSDWTKIPVSRLAEAESKRLVKLEDKLHRRVIGQEEAVHAVASAVKRGRVGLKDPMRPTGSFLFLGPTGVGKTELSKALAEAVFGSEENMIRVDMSEYMEKYSVSKLIGSPPGYVGYDEGGQLSEQVRRHPYSVVLFDEIEKAHPDVFNILLQVLDEGHITDAHGKRCDFKNTCIIMTSNAGAQAIVDPKKLGFGARNDAAQDYERMKSGVMNEVRRIFKPEFLNRIDEIIVFHPLNQEEVIKIVGLMTKELVNRAKKELDIDLKITPAVKKEIARVGFSEKYGARPLRRAIQERIENPLTDLVLSGDVIRGGKVTVRLVRNEIRITGEEELPEKAAD